MRHCLRTLQDCGGQGAGVGHCGAQAGGGGPQGGAAGSHPPRQWRPGAVSAGPHCSGSAVGEQQGQRRCARAPRSSKPPGPSGGPLTASYNLHLPAAGVPAFSPSVAPTACTRRTLPHDRNGSYVGHIAALHVALSCVCSALVPDTLILAAGIGNTTGSAAVPKGAQTSGRHVPRCTMTRDAVACT
jgi:hypothetical protein